MKAIVLTVFVFSTFNDVVICIASSDPTSPCVIEGHVSTANNWFGYLANVSVKNTGRMLFEFTYSTDHCCINVLFYTRDQMSHVTSRMNCWQKEYLLRPEDDQIIRLTPRFSWSGCHVTHNSLRPEYSCEGGRSFAAVDNVSSDSTTWYIAISNCATRSGLDISYRLTVYEHVGLCNYQLIAPSYGPLVLATDGEESRVANDENDWSVKWAESLNPTCVIEGTVNTAVTWYGFLANISLRQGGGFYFRIQFPVKPQQPVATQSVHLLLYTDNEINRLDSRMTCWQRYAVIRQRSMYEQVIELDQQSSWNGCASDNLTENGFVVNCRGQRRFNEPRIFHVAAVNCRSSTGLQMKYRFDVYGFNSPPTCASCQYDSFACLIISVLVTGFRSI